MHSVDAASALGPRCELVSGAGLLGFSADLMSRGVTLVTAAGGAICSATARRLAACGCDLILTDRDGDRLSAAASDARVLVAQVVEIVGDLADPEIIRMMMAEGVHELGWIDVMVNGLGDHLGSAAPFEKTTEDQWQSLCEVNLLHVIRCCHAVVPGMKQQGWGRILNLSSVEGIRAAPDLTVYAAFKRAVDGFTRSLAVELAPHGILVNSLALDKTQAFQVNHYELPGEYDRLISTWILRGRYGEPDDIARIALSLASDLNAWFVGDTIAADGGTLAAGGWYRTPARSTSQPLLAQYLESAEVNDAPSHSLNSEDP